MSWVLIYGELVEWKSKALTIFHAKSVVCCCEVFDGVRSVSARTSTGFMSLKIEKSDSSESLLRQQLMCENERNLFIRKSFAQHSFTCGFLNSRRLSCNSLRNNIEGNLFEIKNLRNIWWRFMMRSVSDNENLHNVAYLKQAWSFVALMMKSSHSGLEFWKEKDEKMFIKMWSRRCDME